MQHAGHAAAGTKPLWIGGDGHHRFRRCFEQQAIDRPLVPERNLRDLGWQGEDHVEIFHRQQVFCARRHPVTRGWALALGTVPVLAAVVRNVLVAALATSRHMPAERLRSASLYRRHHLELAQIDMPGIGPPPRRAMLAE